MYKECYLKDRFCRITLNIFSVNDNLNDSIPDFFADVIAGNSNEIKNNVHVPGVVRGILFSKNSHFQYLKCKIIIT